MAGDTVYADLLDALSPISKAGMNPDAAAADRAGTMAKLLGPDDKPKANWYDPPTEEAQNVVPALPDGLQRRPGAAQPAQATPAVPAGVTPSGSPTKPGDLAAQNAATIGLGQTAYAQSLKDVDAMASAPTEDQDPAVIKAQTAVANYAVPTNPDAKDPTTGKPLYKPSVMQRIMRGVQAVGRGGSLIGLADPELMGVKGYGAPNSDYDYDEQARQARETLAGMQLKQAQDAWTGARKKASDVQAAREKLATTGLADATKPSVDQQEVPIHQQTADADTARAYNDSPAGKAEAAKETNDTTLTARQAQIADPNSPLSKQSEANKAYFLASGKLPDPQQATGDEIARSQATAAWRRDNPGKQPTLDDIRSINAAASGSEIKGQSGKPISPALKNKILDEKNAAMMTATALLRDGHDKQGADYTKQDWANDLQMAQDKFEAAIEENGGTFDHMTINPDGSWTAASKAGAPAATPVATPAAAQPAQPKPAQSAPKPPKVGQVVKGYVFQGGDPSSRSSWKPVRK
jgi:hypothetical protein